ncbi:MAG: hypothetical protein C0613_14975 [Desulfobulbaceae bacterium]|nr:MAG: hypothetical protein C0613_14975 [Desulfobulbaceae bacterium]
MNTSNFRGDYLRTDITHSHSINSSHGGSTNSAPQQAPMFLQNRYQSAADKTISASYQNH